MTMPDEGVQAVAEQGRYTERQARFLVTVMRHAGVCVPRQYARFCGIQYGAKTQKFFSKLVRLGHASVMECRHNRARLYHVKPRALYRAIGDEECRFRRQMPLGLALHRLMLLDAIVESPDHMWLATAEEKATHLLALTRIVRDDLPHITIGEGAGKTVRYFPDHLPIGIHPEGRGVLVFAVTTWELEDLRAFLIGHAAVLRALPCWTIRLVVPPHLECAREAATETVDDQLLTPMRASTIEELRWYFEAAGRGRDASTARRFYLARRSFSHGRTHALHRAWRHEGDAVFSSINSSVLADAVAAGNGRIEVLSLGHRYAHLSPLAAIS